MSEYEPGPWSVWSDAIEPVAAGVSEADMKRLVNNDSTETLYGEHQDGQQYEGE